MLRSRRLVVLAFAFLLVLLMALEGRLFYLQIVKNPTTLATVTRYQLRDVPVPQPRGRIVDANERVLAESLPAYDVELWRPSVGDARQLSSRLSPYIAVPAEELQSGRDKNSFAMLEADLADQAKLIPMMELAERGQLRGVNLRKDFVRRYPQGELAGWAVGLVDCELRGIFGIERLCNDWLTPQSGERTLRHDGRNVEYFDPQLDSSPGQPGCEVVLTLDILMQDVIHSALAALAANNDPDSAFAIVTNPKTGEILAFDQWPPLNPGDLNKPPGVWRSRVFQDYYTPGSTFKPFMMAYALDRGVVHLWETIDCENGILHVPGRHPIQDVHPMGEVPLRDVMVHSSNIGMIKITQRLVPADERKGGQAFQPIIDQLHALGFGERTGVSDSESAGSITALKNWHRNQTLTSIAFGYEIGVTAAQMAAAYSAICNDGVLKPLRLIKEVRRQDGVVEVPMARQPRRVMSRGTATAVRDMMRGVIDEGTGKAVDFPPVQVAGKSGTTTPPGRFDPERGRPKVASFLAFAPADDPTLLVLVVARKEAVKGSYWGATVAGPAVREIIEKGLALQGVTINSQCAAVGEGQGHAGY